MTLRFGCIEAGGTKFVVGIVSGSGDIGETLRVDTTSPEETLVKAFDWLRAQGSLDAIGIASFGPVELDRASPHWGFITRTTKHGWDMTDFGARAAREFGVPVGFDTDVNGAALSEARWGAAKGQKIAVYVTIGTGIGGGAIVDGVPLQGLSHPEMGHVRLQRHAEDLGFKGSCPFHGDCLEGLASGPAIMARYGVSLSEMPQDHVAHEMIAFYIGQFVTLLQSMMEPGRIVLGGGVMGTPGLIERVRIEADRIGGGYFRGKAEEIVVAPGLGNKAGLLGALALAQDALASA
jgi:fructokinase